jgi:hypothetical protein
MQALRGIRGEAEQAYYTVSPEARVQYTALYLGLAGFLAIMCHELHQELPRT